MSTMERLTVHASKALYKQQTLNHPKSIIFVIMLLLHTALTAFSNISLLAHSLCPASPLTTPIIISSRRCDECPRTLYDLFNRTPILPDDVTFQIFSHFHKFSLCCRFIMLEAIVSRSVKDRRIRESSIPCHYLSPICPLLSQVVRLIQTDDHLPTKRFSQCVP